MWNDRRSFIKIAATALPALSQTNTRATRPNVLVILTDDQGYGDMSCHGNPVLKTPNIDRLHAESVRFTDFHVAPMCTPTRGQLMSGVDALRNKATSVTAGRAFLRRDLPTMADLFRAGGYRTGIFGKWHLGDHYPYRPMDRGFETAKYFLSFGLSSAPEFDNDYFNGRYHDNGVVKKFPGYCTDFWFSEAMKWMGERKTANESFFCYLATNTPHGPQWVEEKYAAPYRSEGVPAKFFGMIANLDENLGKLETFLRDNGLRENTIVVFMTDNGATAGFNIHNAGMRGRKTMIYEGGHRVPCFVRWPAGKLRAAGDVDTPAQIQDLLPTMIDLCGLKAPAKASFDGRSLAPILLGKDAGPDRIMVVQYGQIPKKWESTIIWRKWRLVNGAELYDIGKDPGQKVDTASANAAVVAKMRAHYEKWWASVETGLKDFCPVSIGAKQQNPVYLTSADWEEIYADNPTHVSNAVGGPRGGPWNVFVESDGHYEIMLTRWPPQQRLALDTGRAPQKLTDGSLPEGKAMPVAGAKLTIAGQERAMKTAPGQKAATFNVRLNSGIRTKLHGWFTDGEGRDLCGAFYATVRKV
jgi:arylsulfatase